MVKREHYMPARTLSANRIVQALSVSYTVQDELQMQSFLEAHQYLVPLLDEAHARITEYFPNTPLHLQITDDPEGETQDQHLVVYIGTTLPPSIALAHLKRFDGAWWLRNVDQARGKMTINLDLR